MRSIRQTLLVVALGGTMVAAPALAQQPASYPPPCDTSKVSKGDVDRAHTVFLSGKQYLDESNYDKAISYFNDAYSIDCSVHAILPIIATAYERKGDKGEAVRALEEYLRRAPAAPDREHIERRIKNLNDQLAREPPPAAAPAPVTTAAPPPTTAPPTGTTSVPSGASAATPASTVTPAPAATDVEASPHSHGAAPWILTGVGGAAVVGGLVVLLIGNGDISTAESSCGGGRNNCATVAAKDQGNRGITLERVGGAVAIAGAVVLGGGLLWHFLEKPGASQASGAFLTPVVTPVYAGLALGSSL